MTAKALNSRLLISLNINDSFLKKSLSLSGTGLGHVAYLAKRTSFIS